MPTDITELILDDHERFRRAFARLDELQADPATSVDQLSEAWEPLADLLDVHAAAEEEVFYPQLLRRGDNAEDETEDAIGDHNDIRDAVRDTRATQVGSDPWWEAVGQARVANDEHMAEEEREALADFRRNSPKELRTELGERFTRYKIEHPESSDVDTSDIDPEEYIRAEQPDAARESDNSLGIGSLRGR
ncbi:MAG TPA: hemerythrin domain-containing protein [Pseudonocardia sp.]|nr:hemerythrin domain-containing protein [Pseudonocardia sp.]